MAKCNTTPHSHQENECQAQCERLSSTPFTACITGNISGNEACQKIKRVPFIDAAEDFTALFEQQSDVNPLCNF